MSRYLRMLVAALALGCASSAWSQGDHAYTEGQVTTISYIKVKPGMFDAYMRYLEKTGIPGSRGTPGNRGVYVLRRGDGANVHFLFVSLWESWDAIRAFAGGDVERARYYPEDRVFLLELEPTVTHYEVGYGEVAEPSRR